MSDNEFIAQMFLQAQNLKEEIEVMRQVDVEAMVERAFNDVFGGNDEQ